MVRSRSGPASVASEAAVGSRRRRGRRPPTARPRPRAPPDRWPGSRGRLGHAGRPGTGGLADRRGPGAGHLRLGGIGGRGCVGRAAVGGLLVVHRGASLLRRDPLRATAVSCAERSSHSTVTMRSGPSNATDRVESERAWNNGWGVVRFALASGSADRGGRRLRRVRPSASPVPGRRLGHRHAHAEPHAVADPTPTATRPTPRRNRRRPRRPRPRRPRSPSRLRSPGSSSRRACAKRHPIAVMIDDIRAARPQSGPAPGGRGLARPGRGRHPALHGDLPVTPSDVDRAGPQRPLLLRRLGGRVEGAVRPLRRVPAGARDAPGQGQRPVRLRRQRVPLRRALLPSHQGPALARTTSTRTARPCASWPRPAAPRTRRTSRSGQFAPDAPLEARPYGGSIKVRYPQQHDHLSLRPRLEHVQALGHRRGQAVRCGRRRARRAARTSS